MNAGRELRAALASRPRGLGRTLARELVWAIPALLLLAWAGDLLRVTAPPPAPALLRLAALLFVAPALLEELLFRGLLIRRDRPRAWQLLLSTALFVLWHPLQAVTVGPPWAGMFLDPYFLASVAVLGAVNARLYAATGSLWPPVFLHWLVVLVWKTRLGGPF